MIHLFLRTYQLSSGRKSNRFVKIAEFIMVYKCGSMSDLETQLKEAGDKLVVIDFFATWCGPCKMISPVLEEMEAQMSNVKFLKVDVDEAEDVAVQPKGDDGVEGRGDKHFATRLHSPQL